MFNCKFISCIRLLLLYAKDRNITGDKIKTISALSWVSLLTGGTTWVIALIVALVYRAENFTYENEKMPLTDFREIGEIK